MGWSCTMKAINKMESIENQLSIKYPHIHETTKQLMRGSWIYQNNNYFTEYGYTEHADGKITGLIHRTTPDGKHAVKCGTIHISADGEVKRWDKLPPDINK